MGDREKDLSITRSQGLLAVFLAGEPFAEGQPVPQTLPAANPAARDLPYDSDLAGPRMNQKGCRACKDSCHMYATRGHVFSPLEGTRNHSIGLRNVCHD